MADTATTAPASARGRSRIRGGGRVVQYVGFLPAMALFGIFFALPLGLIVAYSFWETIDYNVVHHWTLDNYRYFFSVSTYIHTMWATIWVAVAATVATIGLAAPFTYWPGRATRRPAAPSARAVILPFWTSYLLRVYSWLNILGDGSTSSSSGRT
jgi:spermidine/putrescine transport system permease protein